MSNETPQPTQTESPFGFDEFFFSTTDKKGVVRSGNDVFVRVSAYPKDSIIGAPHSLVRHPDMPRSVFKLFWDTLKADKPIGAYVKNLSANGNYYWVFAFAFPLEDGYLSIRFKPSSQIFDAVKNIYSEVLDFEKQSNSLDDAELLLLEKIKNAGFVNYETFMVSAALGELSSRSQKAQEIDRDKYSAQSSSDGSERGLDKISEIAHSTSSQLSEVFARVQKFQDSSRIFSETIDSMNTGFMHLKFISLNMTIAAAKFGGVAQSLGVVSKEFARLSAQIEGHLSGLSGFVDTLSQVIRRCSLQIAALNVLMQMVEFFVKESITKVSTTSDAFAEMNENRSGFSKLFNDYSVDLKKEVLSMRGQLSSLTSEMEEVQKFVVGLEVIRQIGSVESARIDEMKLVFVHYLEAMNGFIQLIKTSSIAIHSEVRSLEQTSKSIVSSVVSLDGRLDAIFDMSLDFTHL